MKLVRSLDKYCQNAMHDALVDALALAGPPGVLSLIPRYMTQKQSLEGRLSEKYFFNWFYRHRTVSGRTHIRNVRLFQNVESVLILLMLFL